MGLGNDRDLSRLCRCEAREGYQWFLLDAQTRCRLFMPELRGYPALIGIATTQVAQCQRKNLMLRPSGLNAAAIPAADIPAKLLLIQQPHQFFVAGILLEVLFSLVQW